MINSRIPGFLLEVTMSTGTLLTNAEQRAEFLAIIQLSLDRARASIRRTQESCKKDFHRCVCKSSERIRRGDYVFINVSD